MVLVISQISPVDFNTAHYNLFPEVDEVFSPFDLWDRNMRDKTV